MDTTQRQLLFTPGPLTTSPTVKAAMLRDYGSRDPAFIDLVVDVRARLCLLASDRPHAWTAVPMQGSGTFGVEATLGTLVPRGGTLLVAQNGAYGRRLVDIATRLGIATHTVTFAEDQPVDPHAVDEALQAHPDVAVVACVHSETTSGLLNPIAAIGAVVHAHGKLLVADAMSSFGGVPLDIDAACIDALVSSSNKCIEGVPGFSFALVRRDVLATCAGQARSVSLDLHAQANELDRSGQFRFTPPTHVIAAFHQALVELTAEGGIPARHVRYQANRTALLAGLARLGLQTWLPDALQGPIITSVRYPLDPHFDFPTFYQSLAARGFTLYPGKVAQADCFRVGTIGQLFPADFDALSVAMGDVLTAMGVTLPAAPENRP